LPNKINPKKVDLLEKHKLIYNQRILHASMHEIIGST